MLAFAMLVASNACAVDPPIPAASQAEALQDWVARHAVPLQAVATGGDGSDLEAVAGLIRPDTRVIGFGEAVHWTHELLSLRNRLFAHLVEHHGVTAYVGETSFTAATRVDDYITRGGELTRDILESVYLAVPAEIPEAGSDERWRLVQGENLELIEWMRAYNLRPTTRRPVRFYGADACLRSHDGGESGCMDAAVAAVLDYLRTIDTGLAAAFAKRILPYVDFYSRPSPSGRLLGMSERDAFTASLADLVSLFEEQRAPLVRVKEAVPDAFHRAYRNAVVVRKLDAEVRSHLGQSPFHEIPGNRAQSMRDPVQAENVLWALQREGPDGRVFFFAHDGHLDRRIKTVAGRHLQEALGRGFVMIGTVGTNPVGRRSPMLQWYPSLRTLLDATGMPVLFLDAKGMPPVMTTVEEQARIGCCGLPVSSAWRVQDSFDGVIFVQSLTAAGRAGSGHGH